MHPRPPGRHIGRGGGSEEQGGRVGGAERGPVRAVHPSERQNECHGYQSSLQIGWKGDFVGREHLSLTSWNIYTLSVTW